MFPPDFSVARKRLFHPAPNYRLEGEMVDQQFYLPNNAVLVAAPVAEGMAACAEPEVVANIRAMRMAWGAARQPVLDCAADGLSDEAGLKARLRREGLNCLVLAGGFTENSLAAAVETFGNSRFETYVVTDAVTGADRYEDGGELLTAREAIGALAPDHEPSRATSCG